MSMRAVTWALHFSNSEKSARLVLIALADHANDDGAGACPSVATLMKKSRLSERAVQYALRTLEDLGEIEQTGISRDYGTTMYHLLMGGAKTARGAKNGSEIAPEPKAVLSPNGERVVGNARARLRIGGKFVDEDGDAWKLTKRALAEFNRQSGRDLRLLTSAEKPSEAAKRVYLRVLDYPDLTFDDHVRIIGVVLASKWWGASKPSIGVVYGPKVFEDNIARKPNEMSAQTVRDAREAHKEEMRKLDERRLAAFKRVAGISDNPPEPHNDNGGNHADDGRRMGGDQPHPRHLLAG
jgi:Helix-turn-helix domain